MKTSYPQALLMAGLTVLLATQSARAQVEGEEGEEAVVQPDTTETGSGAIQALPISGDGADAVDLDGRLDEEAWGRAVPISDFTQQEPVEGGVPSERTEVRIVYDDANLYIGAMVFDDPEAVIAYQRERDAPIGTDDRFMWIIDTFLDGRTGYLFEINPAGLMGDGIIGAGGGGGGFGGGGGGAGGGGGGGGGGFRNVNKAWDGIWEARTTMLPDGWSAEIRIPFRTLNFDPDLDQWGINFQRTIRRRNEEVLWRGYQRNQGIFSPIFAGRVEGLEGMSQGLGLEAVPSMVGGWRHVPCAEGSGCAPDHDASTFPTDLSLDLNYSVTSSLRASASINTDFAEVESDQRRVNLTRFALRFPERRDFFLEGSGVFSFAPSSGPSPFYSRNIGIDPGSGQQVPIQYGTRFTGQAGAYELGFYQIGTADHTYFDADETADLTIPGESFTVARVRRRFLEQSAIGFIYTRRSRAEFGTISTAGHTAGVDLDFSTRRFMGDNNLEIEAFVAWNSDLDPDASDDFVGSFGRLSSRGLRFDFPNDPWTGSLSYREFGDGYDPALGFVTRNNFRRLDQSIGWSPRPEISWIRNLDFSARFQNQWALDTGRLEEQELQLDLLGINFESSDRFSIGATRTREYLDQTFEVSDGIPVAVGDHSWWEVQLSGRTASQRMISFFGWYSVGGFWDGDRSRISGRLSMRPNPGISFSTNIEHNDVRMPAGDFTANVFEVEGQWNPSPWVAFTNQVQYDDVSELLGLFARLRWIVTPGNDVFLVYSHNWRNERADLLGRPDRGFTTISNGASLKLSYTYRF